MGSQLRLRFEQHAKLLKKTVARVARRDQRIQAREVEIKNLEALLEAEADMKKAGEAKNTELSKELDMLRIQLSNLQVSNKQLTYQVSTLQGQVTGEERRIIASLHAEFSMTDLGSLNYFLGVSVTRNTSGMFQSQQKYATEVLEQAGMLTCNACHTPVDTDSMLVVAGDPVSDPTLYRSLTGDLQYLTFTRPDISYVVQQVCLFMHDPREPHFFALKRILRYVHGTLTSGLQLYSSTTSSLVAYSDADWAGCFISVGYGTRFFSPNGEWGWERRKGKIIGSANDVAKDIINVVSFVFDEPVLSSLGGHTGEKVIASGNYNGTQERNVVQRLPSISSTVDLNEVNVPLVKAFVVPINVTDSPTTDPNNSEWSLVHSQLLIHSKKWNFRVNLIKEDVGNGPIWVKFHGVPMTALSEDGLSVIAIKLGPPLCVCNHGVGQVYARALIEKIRATWRIKASSRWYCHVEDECPKKDSLEVVKQILCSPAHSLCSTLLERVWLSQKAKKQSDQASRQVSKQASGSTNAPHDLVFPATGPSLGTTQPTATITSTEDLRRVAFTTPPQTALGTNSTRGATTLRKQQGHELGADNLTLEGVATELAPSDFVSQTPTSLWSPHARRETKKRTSQNYRPIKLVRRTKVSPPRHRKERRREDNRRPPVFGRIGKQVSGTQTANLQNLSDHENNDWRVSVHDRLGNRDVHSRLGQRRSSSESPPVRTPHGDKTRLQRRRRVDLSSEDTSDNEEAEKGRLEISKNRYREDEDMSLPWRRQKVEPIGGCIS
ncbi:ribonuclease H-like domain-containing protein [Tanacetum coccineum]